jgi:hypothetical protein
VVLRGWWKNDGRWVHGVPRAVASVGPVRKKMALWWRRV